MIKVLFVCLGNICRSPLAEALFLEKVKKAGLEKDYKIDSCGTSDYHIGELPDERTMANAEKNGLIIKHRGRQFSTDDFRLFDHIIVMDQSNKEKVLSLSSNEKQRNKIRLMRAYESDTSLKGTDVPDPYYGGEKGFQNVFEILDRTTQNLFESLQQ